MSSVTDSTNPDARKGAGRPQVVFACVRNGGRSVIARVLTEHYARGRVLALSAGTEPGECIHREVADVLEKLGLDTSKEHPKLLTRDTIAASDLAITLGCGEECPYVPGVTYRDWSVADPGGQDEQTVRRIIADLDTRVRRLLVELVPDIDLPPSVLAPTEEPTTVTEQVTDRQSIHEELERARTMFHDLLARADEQDLRRQTNGTGWTNAQMLFHMLFGYMVVKRLLPLVRLLGRLPDGYSRSFARALNAGTRPFHTINYLGSCGGALVFHDERLAAGLDRTIASLHRHLDREAEATLARRMHFPVGWDPFFRDTMSLLEVYHYGTQHFEFHKHQLTLPPEAEPQA